MSASTEEHVSQHEGKEKIVTSLLGIGGAGEHDTLIEPEAALLEPNLSKDSVASFQDTQKDSTEKAHTNMDNTSETNADAKNSEGTVSDVDSRNAGSQ